MRFDPADKELPRYNLQLALVDGAANEWLVDLKTKI